MGRERPFHSLDADGSVISPEHTFPCIVKREDDLTLWLTVSAQSYSREALLRACYWSSRTFYMFIGESAAVEHRVRCRRKDGLRIEDSDLADFADRLLEEELRVLIGENTHYVRDLLVSRALAHPDHSPGATMHP